MADGVKIFNQETWKLVISSGDQGKQTLCLYASDVTEFYIT